MEYAREEAAGGAPFDAEKDQRLTIIENKCIAMAWEAVDLSTRQRARAPRRSRAH